LYIVYVVIITVPSPSSSHNDITTHLGTKSDTDQRLPIKQMTNTKHKTQKKTEFINTKQIQNTKSSRSKSTTQQSQQENNQRPKSSAKIESETLRISKHKHKEENNNDNIFTITKKKKAKK
jgi:hypothetical protein